MTSIAPTETLSRFIVYNKTFKPSRRFTAFEPNRNGKTSVFRTSGITNEGIWDIGDREVAPKRGKPILGRADINASNIIAKDLEVIPNEPPERHADITGWPSEASEQKVIALELAAEAQFHKK